MVDSAKDVFLEKGIDRVCLTRRFKSSPLTPHSSSSGARKGTMRPYRNRAISSRFFSFMSLSFILGFTGDAIYGSKINKFWLASEGGSVGNWTRKTGKAP